LDLFVIYRLNEEEMSGNLPAAKYQFYCLKEPSTSKNNPSGKWWVIYLKLNNNRAD